MLDMPWDVVNALCIDGIFNTADSPGGRLVRVDRVDLWRCDGLGWVGGG